ncbi:ervatamin-B-like [Malania oleifera]|uniref:ervatamin-B-like n=1 Tax=Malania oleifera TaxID=397392 RepID=UPI0025ADB794|nr:ervatamin-B-like [Malania oleifera]
MSEISRSIAVLLSLGFWAFCRAQSRPLPEAAAFMQERHQLWMRRHGRVYTDSAEGEMRFKIFRDNVGFIEAFNRDGSWGYKLGVNEFADQTNEEFQASRNGYKMLSRLGTTSFRHENVSAVPLGVDWREKGVVTPVKDQGQCGSCWAFSAVAAMEGINQLTTGKLISLSEQELLDCDTSGEDKGCNGGYMDNAFEFILHNQGLTTESNYPYEGVEGTCNAKKAASRTAMISGYEDVPTNDENALVKAVAKQPVSVAIDAGGHAIQFYSSGVFTGRCGTKLNHAVTVVGYGKSDDGTKYWLVKNSWGYGWGEDGYIRMQRDVNAKKGLCGIAMDASYPIA